MQVQVLLTAPVDKELFQIETAPFFMISLWMCGFFWLQ